MSSAVELVRRPEARTDSVEDLVAAVLRGEVRIPVFQRGLEWHSSDVVDLFDSIYRGFPIGSLLLRRAPASAGDVKIGPVTIFGAESTAALWVVDGQQRLTSLVGGLGRPGPLPATPDDPFVVYFDPGTQQFSAPPRDGKVPSAWVPVPRLLDGGQLTEWVHEWAHGADPLLRRVVFEAGRRLREYRVPLYVIETDDEESIRTIFHRVNSAGRPLTWVAVHDALFGHKGKEPATLAELASQLEAVGMGRPDEETQLLPCLLALRGLDVTRSFGEHVDVDRAILDGAAAEALPVLREVLSFLRVSAEVPHLRLLPCSAPLVVLTRFFQKHPRPNDRTTALLVRWVWRFFLALGAVDERTVKRHGVTCVTEDEEESVQSLLALVPEREGGNFLTPLSFDARSVQSRLTLLGMASLRPQRLDVTTGFGAPIDVAGLIREVDLEAFRPLYPLKGGKTRSPANRLLLPGSGPAVPELRAFFGTHGLDHPILRSHAISPEIADAVLAGEADRAIELRDNGLCDLVDSLGQRLAGWGRNDRPSLEYLLAKVGAE